MEIKKITTSFFLLVTLVAFSQKKTDSTKINKPATPISYLDSIKKTFVKNTVASKIDSLWLNDLTSLDTYNDITTDIQTINTDKNVDFELPTELLKERLKAMDAKSPFNISYNQGLENLIKSFLKNRKKSFERLMGISAYYFPLFEEALAKKNVPLEIKYLAVVESSLNPKAISRVGATGLWQFMYQTGKQYNLNVDSYIDERSDPLKASEAAAQYMANMYAIFNNWELVLASYNSGAGNVTKAIRRSGGEQDFWDIKKHLPKETQSYVPAFLATMYIYEYHKEHGIVPNKALVKHFDTDTIRIKRQLSFKQISNLLDVPESLLALLNPTYKRNVIPCYKDKNVFLRLPQDKIGLFTSNEAQIYAYADYESTRKEKWIPLAARTALAQNDTLKKFSRKNKPDPIANTLSASYTVQAGDNLTAIATKYNTTVEEIKKWNKLKGNAVAYGKNLIISAPKNTTSDPYFIAQKQATEPDKGIVEQKQQPTELYIVQKGENLIAIANKYSMSVAQLKVLNNLKTVIVKAGASLLVSKSETNLAIATTPKELINTEYTVAKGDNLNSIAKKFGVSPDNLKQWNGIKGNNLALGANIIVYKNEPLLTGANEKVSSFKKNDTNLAYQKEVSYYVKKGDSLYSISKKYPGVTIADIKKWNGINEEEIRPGMKLKING